MDKKAQMEFEMEDLVFAGFGLLGGGLALFIMKSAGLGLFWKIATFAATAVAGFFVTKIIFNKG